MKNSLVTFSAASVLLISLIIIGTFKTGIVSALTATTTYATSTTSDTTTTSTSSSPTTPATSTTTPTTDASSTPAAPPTQTQASAQSQAQPSTGKPTLKLVHVVGTKYLDYFSDGKKTYALPGDPKVDSRLNLPNAPIPFHSGLTWVSTSGKDAYDTTSGDLDPGDYAQEADGSYISNVPAYTYTDATSSVPVAAHLAFSKTDPTVAAVTASAPASETQGATTATNSATTTPVTSDTTAASSGTSTATSTQ